MTARFWRHRLDDKVIYPSAVMCLAGELSADRWDLAVGQVI
jgi:hypothetical protein